MSILRGNPMLTSQMATLASLANSKPTLSGRPYLFLPEMWEVPDEPAMLKLGCADRGELPGGVAIRADLGVPLQLTGPDYRDAASWTAYTEPRFFVATSSSDGRYTTQPQWSWSWLIGSSRYPAVKEGTSAASWVTRAAPWQYELERLRTDLRARLLQPIGLAPQLINGEFYAGPATVPAAGLSESRYVVGGGSLTLATTPFPPFIWPVEELEFFWASNTDAGVALEFPFRLKNDGTNGTGATTRTVQLHFKLRVQSPFPVSFYSPDTHVPATGTLSFAARSELPLGISPTIAADPTDPYGTNNGTTYPVHLTQSKNIARIVHRNNVAGQRIAYLKLIPPSEGGDTVQDEDVTIDISIDAPYTMGVTGEGRYVARGLFTEPRQLEAAIHTTAPAIYKKGSAGLPIKSLKLFYQRTDPAVFSGATIWFMDLIAIDQPLDPAYQHNNWSFLIVYGFTPPDLFPNTQTALAGFFRARVPGLGPINIAERNLTSDTNDPWRDALKLAAHAEDRITNAAGSVAIEGWPFTEKQIGAGAIVSPIPRSFFRKTTDTPNLVPLRIPGTNLARYQITNGSTLREIIIRRLPGADGQPPTTSPPLQVELGCIRSGTFVTFGAYILPADTNQLSLRPDWINFDSYSLAYQCAEELEIQAMLAAPFPGGLATTGNIHPGPILADHYNGTESFLNTLP